MMVYLLMGIVFFGAALRHDPKAAMYIFAGLTVFGMTGPGMFGFGVAVAMEREHGLLKLRRALPAPRAGYFVAKWNSFDGFYNHSPMAFVKGVTTPTLILHGEADVRVPATQGYEFYNALKRQGVAAKMVVYPRTPHGPREPKFLLDIMQRRVEWVDKYVTP